MTNSESATTTDGRHLRIGAVAARTGMTESALRAWQRRYGVPEPVRSTGGHRMYAESNVVEIRQIRALVNQGYTVLNAATLVRKGQVPQLPGPGEILDGDTGLIRQVIYRTRMHPSGEDVIRLKQIDPISE